MEPVAVANVATAPVAPVKALAIVLLFVSFVGCLYTSVDDDGAGSGELGEQFRCVGKAYCNDVIEGIEREYCAAPGSELDLAHALKLDYETAGCTVLGKLICGGVGSMEGDGILRPCVLDGDHP